MSKSDRIKEILVDENDVPPLFLDDFDEALIGIYRNKNTGFSVPVYSYLKLVGSLLGADLIPNQFLDVREEEAVEYVDNFIMNEHNPQFSEVIIIDDTGV
tara:strand:- start:360 stop:659 length:300 start_codon:yes stop_codon:yes gene_type:complete